MAIRRPNMTERIVRNPDVLGGEPVVRGTRIPVRSIVLAAREFGGADGVLDAYPQLAPVDVREALAFYRAHKTEIDRHIRANVSGDA